MHDHTSAVGHYPSCTDPTDCWCEVRRYGKLLIVTTGILTIETIGGLLSGSLALLADAGHVFADSAAIFIALTAAVLRKYDVFPRTAKEIGFWVNVALLILIAAFIFHEALDRIHNPQEIESVTLIIVAFIGLLGNYWQHRIHEQAAKEHRDGIHRGISLHIISDLMQSAAVVIGGFIILITGWAPIDALLSCGIAGWIVYRTIKLVHKGSRTPTNP